MEETLVVAAVKDREKLLTALYKSTFPSVARYIQKKGGTFEEAKDIFHDALVVYYEKSLLKPAPVRNEKAYLMGISKHLWTKYFQKKVLQNTFDFSAETISETLKDEIPSTEKLLRFLETAGEKCMELLRSFYYDKIPLNAIAERFGFSGIRSATVQKFKCLEKVRTTVKEKSLRYEDFLD